MFKFLNKTFLRFLAGFAGITVVSMVLFLGVSIFSGTSLGETVSAVFDALR